jgi:hypothetical protein
MAVNGERSLVTRATACGLLLVMTVSACSSMDSSSEATDTSVPRVQTTETRGSFNEEVLCESMSMALESAKWSDYGVQIDACNASVPAKNGDDVFVLSFNDPTQWEDLFRALGDIPPEEGALYAFWRVPLGLLAVGFVIAEVNPNSFDQMLITFSNEKETVYDILPRDIAYVIDIPDSFTKEQYSEALNSRIDEVSRRVEVYNLNE